MPCCIVTNNVPGVRAGLNRLADLFARFQGGGHLNPVAHHPEPLTSALHFEMCLWNHPEPLAVPPFAIDDAFHNSWTAMSQMYAANTFTENEMTRIHEDIIKLPPKTVATSCILGAFDKWILNLILSLRSEGQNLTRNPVLPQNPYPSALASVGRAQKLVNLYLKIELCWQISGFKYGCARPVLHRAMIPHLLSYLCALHAPLDRSLLQKIVSLPLGAWLIDKYLMGNNGDLVQSSDNVARPWSKLDCLRTYYGLQLMLRRVAMASWPAGCACSGAWGNGRDTIGKICGEIDPKDGNKGPDWLAAVFQLPENVILETLKALQSRNRAD